MKLRKIALKIKHTSMTEENNNNKKTAIAVLERDIAHIKEKVNEISDSQQKIFEQYATKEDVDHKVDQQEFMPVKKIVYTVVGVIIISLVGVFFSLIIADDIQSEKINTGKKLNYEISEKH